MSQPRTDEPRAARRIVPYVAALVLLLAASDAHAYLDPASGSLLLQLLVGGAMGALYFVRRHWRSLRTRVIGNTPAEPSEAARTNDDMAR